MRIPPRREFIFTLDGLSGTRTQLNNNRDDVSVDKRLFFLCNYFRNYVIVVLARNAFNIINYLLLIFYAMYNLVSNTFEIVFE